MIGHGKKLGLRARSEKPGLLARVSSLYTSDVDREAAEAVGRFAVQYALAGNSGFMATIRRESSTPLQLSYQSTPLEIASEKARLLPQEYINETKNHIEENFRDYVEPLIGKPLRRYARIENQSASISKKHL